MACTHASAAAVEAAQAQLLSAAQLLLPQLLATYHATMHPEDRACLLALRALDAVLAAPDAPLGQPRPSTPEPPGEPVHGGAGAGCAGSFLSSMAFVWGRLWGHVQRSAAITPEMMRVFQRRPDVIDPRCVAPHLHPGPCAAGSAQTPCCSVLLRSAAVYVCCCLWRTDVYLSAPAAQHAWRSHEAGYESDGAGACRRMALAALYFPEARTQAVSEQDPYRGSPAIMQAAPAASAGYDPATVVPAAAAMLRRGWLDVSGIVCGGWLPLLLRCLGCADEALRCASGRCMHEVHARARAWRIRYCLPDLAMCRHTSMDAIHALVFHLCWD